jgi:hypothetical protein
VRQRVGELARREAEEAEVLLGAEEQQVVEEVEVLLGAEEQQVVEVQQEVEVTWRGTYGRS